MAKKRTGGGMTITLGWPFAPTQVGTNRDTTVLKLLAIAAMVCDHAGKMLFPQYRIMRVIGRIAFPLFAYCIAVGCVYTRDMLKYLERVVITALISQPIYAVAMAHTCPAMYSIRFTESPILAAVNFYANSWYHPSIFLTLSLGIVCCWSIREKKWPFMIALALMVWKMSSAIDYSWRGVALIVLFYVTCSKWWISLPIVGTFLLWWAAQGSGYEVFGVKFGIQLFAVIALPFVYIPMNSKLKLNKWVFYCFYPGHLILIWVLYNYVFK